MRVAEAKGRLLGKQPKLSSTQEALFVELHRAGMYASGELVELFGVARLTAYWALRGAGANAPAPEAALRRLVAAGVVRALVVLTSLCV